MNRWQVTVLVERVPRRGFPRVHRIAFDVRPLLFALLAFGAVLGFAWR